VTLFTHLGGDIGDYTSWRVGGSWLTQRAEGREGGIPDADGFPLFDQFTGDSDTWVVDGVLKWAPSPRRQLKVQGEYLHRRESGEIADSLGTVLADNYRNTSSGWYLQSVYQFAAALARGRALRLARVGCAELHVRAAGPARMRAPIASR
jgi:hypothetical protein